MERVLNIFMVIFFKSKASAKRKEALLFFFHFVLFSSLRPFAVPDVYFGQNLFFAPSLPPKTDLG